MLQNYLRGSVTQSPVGDLCRRFTKLTGPCAHTLHSNPIPPIMVQAAFCDLLHTLHKQVTNVSKHVFVILLWGILTSPLTRSGEVVCFINRFFFFFFNCMFYQLLRVQHSCSSTQSWGSVLPSIVEMRDQNSWGCPLLFSNRNLGSFCA